MQSVYLLCDDICVTNLVGLSSEKKQHLDFVLRYEAVTGIKRRKLFMEQI